MEPCLVDFVHQFGVQAKLVVPIIQPDRQHSADREDFKDCSVYLWGLLIAHQCGHPRQWKDWEVELMKQLSTQVAITIQQSELYKQLQQFKKVSTVILLRTLIEFFLFFYFIKLVECYEELVKI
jgi:GAF domain-containing protein